MRWPGFVILVVLGFAAIANAEPAKILKVLPHFLDHKGRSAINPSLFDRDAYQEELRITPTNRSALRFNVQWKARGPETLTLRIDARGAVGKNPTRITLEQPVKPGHFSRWAGLTLAGDDYARFGDLIAWRATLLNGTNIVAEQKSFLW